MRVGESPATYQALTIRRTEIWTSVHGVSWTRGLRIKSMTHHSDAPGWDDHYLHVVQWSEDVSRWEIHKRDHAMQSSVSDMVVTRCLGATVNPYNPTRGTCNAPDHDSRWVVCNDGTICRKEHCYRERRPSDWVLWGNNTFGRRALGMYNPVQE